MGIIIKYKQCSSYAGVALGRLNNLIQFLEFIEHFGIFKQLLLQLLLWWLIVLFLIILFHFGIKFEVLENLYLIGEYNSMLVFPYPWCLRSVVNIAYIKLDQWLQIWYALYLGNIYFREWNYETKFKSVYVFLT